VQKSLLGETDLHEAMLALEKVDLSLRLLVQVRNKLVQAYEELNRMAI
jgi:flagellar hook-basal body complex protein FliE